MKRDHFLRKVYLPLRVVDHLLTMFPEFVTSLLLFFLFESLSSNVLSAINTRDEQLPFPSCFMIIVSVGVPRKLDPEDGASYDLSFIPSCFSGPNYTKAYCNRTFSPRELGTKLLQCSSNQSWTPKVIVEQNNSTSRLPADGGVRFNLSAQLPQT